MLMNDWSARDVQKWEYQPLGPFNAKNFATTLSPWVVPRKALEPFTVPGPRRRRRPEPRHLTWADDFGVDLTLTVEISSARMRETGTAPTLVSTGNYSDMYWTIYRCSFTTSTGCPMNPGDVFASGTVSGVEKSTRVPAGTHLARAEPDHPRRRHRTRVPPGRGRGADQRVLRTGGCPTDRLRSLQRRGPARARDGARLSRADPGLSGPVDHRLPVEHHLVAQSQPVPVDGARAELHRELDEADAQVAGQSQLSSALVVPATRGFRRHPVHRPDPATIVEVDDVQVGEAVVHPEPQPRGSG